jgi:hypothetical protein
VESLLRCRVDRFSRSWTSIALRDQVAAEDKHSVEEPEIKPLEREALTDEDVMAEIRWATGKHFET